MESESGAKIAIRGKGSVKEGKGRSDAAHTSNQEEDLHCLIMADTEDKVNKAKKLIHNVIETVCVLLLIRFPSSLTTYRPHLFPKVRTSSSATNFVSLLLLTVHCVMTRTRLARIAERLVIASTTAPRSQTSPRPSFVVFVDKLDTWLEIVLSASLELVGAMTTELESATRLASAVLRTTLTTFSMKWMLAVADLLDPSNMAMEVVTAMKSNAAPSHGSVVRPEDKLPGLVTTVMIETMVAPLLHGRLQEEEEVVAHTIKAVTMALQLLGLRTREAMRMATTATVVVTSTMALRVLHLLA